MLVHFESAHDEGALRALLVADGWKLGGVAVGAFHASHARADDQPAARFRLHQLGLLTSARVRIEFGFLPAIEVKRRPRKPASN